MQNLRIFIEYDGTDFYGWQYQPNARTVQGEIENALEQLLNAKIRIIGAGRTDHGVHAICQVANFHTSSNLKLHQIKKGINSLTEDDVYIKDIDVVDNDFHSRYSAKTKIYHYYIVLEPSPLKLRYNWFVKHKLNVTKMKKVIPYILGEHDFKLFSANKGKDNTVCTIYNMNLTEDNSHIIIKIEGNRFLRKMVRGIVGFIHDVGRGRFSPGNVKEVFNSKIKDIYFAPSHGLCLVEVKY